MRNKKQQRQKCRYAPVFKYFNNKKNNNKAHTINTTSSAQAAEQNQKRG